MAITAKIIAKEKRTIGISKVKEKVSRRGKNERIIQNENRKRTGTKKVRNQKENRNDRTEKERKRGILERSQPTQEEIEITPTLQVKTKEIWWSSQSRRIKSQRNHQKKKIRTNAQSLINQSPWASLYQPTQGKVFKATAKNWKWRE